MYSISEGDNTLQDESAAQGSEVWHGKRIGTFPSQELKQCQLRFRENGRAKDFHAEDMTTKLSSDVSIVQEVVATVLGLKFRPSGAAKVEIGLWKDWAVCPLLK